LIAKAVLESEAERLLSEHAPDVALVDFHLRGGELSDGLIARLREQGVPVIMISGSVFPPLLSVEAVTILEKPVSEAQLLANLRPLLAQKTARGGVLPRRRTATVNSCRKNGLTAWTSFRNVLFRKIIPDTFP
jgi:DNA-binding response OmpR family regulator